MKRVRNINETKHTSDYHSGQGKTNCSVKDIEDTYGKNCTYVLYEKPTNRAWSDGRVVYKESKPIRNRDD